MNNLLKKPLTFEKVEFWCATAIYCIFIFTLLGQMINTNNNGTTLGIITAPLGNDINSDNFLPLLLRDTIFYGWFLIIDLVVIQFFIKARYILLNIVLLLVVCVSCAIFLVVTDLWLINPDFNSADEWDARIQFFRQEMVFILFLLLILGFYTIIKQIIKANSPQLTMSALGGRQLVTECLVAMAMLALLGFFLHMSYFNGRASLAWCMALFYAICLYWYISFKILPEVNANKLDQRDYFFKAILALCVSLPIMAVVGYFIFRRLNAVFYLSLFTTIVSLVLVAPLTWFLYQYRRSRNSELQGLKTELGQSSANLDFLRSQINPHFLFNALNTLYGTALQENAERTGSGIQKLGDMMRFMLQENMQEKISLTREVDYLNNYIDLQKLRTQISADIVIQTEIDEEIKGLEIAPMLLIPFVENAFKHGISLREPSQIKISLQTRDKILFFDVSNSIHPKGLNDPEKDKSGIGLENVKQRLQLLYPEKHELTVRESAKEFFIHLTVTLAG